MQGAARYRGREKGRAVLVQSAWPQSSSRFRCQGRVARGESTRALLRAWTRNSLPRRAHCAHRPLRAHTTRRVVRAVCARALAKPDKHPTTTDATRTKEALISRGPRAAWWTVSEFQSSDYPIDSDRMCVLVFTFQFHSTRSYTVQCNFTLTRHHSHWLFHCRHHLQRSLLSSLDSRRHRSSPLRPSIRERRIDLHWSVHHIGHSAGSSSAANRPSSSATSPSRRSLTHSTTPRMHAHQGDSPIARAPTPACVSGMPTGSHNQSRRPRLPRAHAHTHTHTHESERERARTHPRALDPIRKRPHVNNVW